MNVLLVTQARIGSSRLPRKVLLEINDETLLGLHLKRVAKAQNVDAIVVATTEEDGSDLICDIAKSNGANCFKGSLDDVLDRFYQAAIPYSPDYIVRVTSDCPLIDPALIDQVIEKAVEGEYDYYSNILVEDFPDGQDIEVIKMSALTEAWNKASQKFEREHVTPFIRNNADFNGGKLFKSADFQAPENYNHVRMTVDEPADLEMMRWLVKELGTDKTWEEYTKYMLSNPEKLLNAKIIRNEGYLKSIQNED